jgi:hypothetical protein
MFAVIASTLSLSHHLSISTEAEDISCAFRIASQAYHVTSKWRGACGMEILEGRLRARDRNRSPDSVRPTTRAARRA